MRRVPKSKMGFEIIQKTLCLPRDYWDFIQRLADYNGRDLNDEICFQLFHNTPEFEKNFPKIRESVNAYLQSKTKTAARIGAQMAEAESSAESLNLTTSGEAA